MNQNIENYENDIWPQIYDQYNTHRRQHLETEFYYSELKGGKNPVLEPACGTGMVYLELLNRGINIYGFDISSKMLQVLYKKAEDMGIKNIRDRVTLQNMLEFKYPEVFDGIYITARSFLHLETTEGQITCLKSIHDHLSDSGRFLTNLFTPDLELLYQYARENQKFEFYRTFKLIDGRSVEVYLKQEHDLTEQLQYLTWRFKLADKIYDSKMLVRWIHRAEFELLLRAAGFRKWKLYGGFSKGKYDYNSEMVWIAEK